MKSTVTKSLIALAMMCSAFAAAAQEEFKRDLKEVPFVPKGAWITGVSVNYSASSQDNYQFLVVEKLTGDSYSFKVSPTLMYCFKDNLAAGLRFSYARDMYKLDSADLVLDSETNYDVDNLYSIASNYYATAVFRNYISMGRSKRFGFFNECQLQMGGGQAKVCTGSGQDLTGTFETNYNVSIGIAPGVVMFLNNYSAIECNVGLLGFGYTHTKSTTDQIYKAERNSSHARFNVNLFSIAFGVSFYL